VDKIRWGRPGGAGSAPSARSTRGADERVIGRARLAVCEEEAHTFDPDDATWERLMVRRGQRPGTGRPGYKAACFFFIYSVIRDKGKSICPLVRRNLNVY